MALSEPAKAILINDGGEMRRASVEEAENIQKAAKTVVPKAPSAVRTDADRYDVCEIFSPPRLCARAREVGKSGGWSLDLRTPDPVTGRTWDLRDPKQVSRIKWMMRRDRPRVLTL